MNLKKYSQQSFEDVVADLGQVLRINHANKLYTRRGREIRGFSHLRNDFSDEDTFYVSQGPANMNRIIADEEDDERDSGSFRGSQSPGSLRRFGSDPYLTAGGGGGGGGGRRSRPPHRSRSSSRTGSDFRSDEEDRPIKIMVHGAKRIVYPPIGGAYDTVREDTLHFELFATAPRRISWPPCTLKYN